MFERHANEADSAVRVDAATGVYCRAETVRPGPGNPAGTLVAAVSHNRSDVDVYLLCGEATRCGWASFRRVALFMEIPRPKLRCAVGLNFFLVVPDLNQGYWVGPLYPTGGWSVRLVVETYAGLSTAYLQR